MRSTCACRRRRALRCAKLPGVCICAHTHTDTKHTRTQTCGTNYVCVCVWSFTATRAPYQRRESPCYARSFELKLPPSSDLPPSPRASPFHGEHTRNAQASSKRRGESSIPISRRQRVHVYTYTRSVCVRAYDVYSVYLAVNLYTVCVCVCMCLHGWVHIYVLIHIVASIDKRMMFHGHPSSPLLLLRRRRHRPTKYNTCCVLICLSRNVGRTRTQKPHTHTRALFAQKQPPIEELGVVGCVCVRRFMPFYGRAAAAAASALRCRFVVTRQGTKRIRHTGGPMCLCAS